MLLNNYAVINRNTSTNWGIAFTNPMATFRATQLNCFYTGEHVVTGETDRSAFNNGYNGQYAWWPALVAGGLSANTEVTGAGSLASSVAGGVNGEAALTGSGDITEAVAGLIVSAIAALTGSGDLSGEMVGALAAVADLAGSGDLAGALGALASMAADLAGLGDITATTTAVGTMAADINVTGELLTTANVADLIWSRIMDGEFTAQEVLQIIAAGAAGRDDGTVNNPKYRNLADTRNVIDGTVNGSGIRTAVVYDPEG